MDANCIYIYNIILDNAQINKSKKQVAIDILSKYINDKDKELKNILINLIENLKNNNPIYLK